MNFEKCVMFLNRFLRTKKKGFVRNAVNTERGPSKMNWLLLTAFDMSFNMYAGLLFYFNPFIVSITYETCSSVIAGLIGRLSSCAWILSVTGRLSPFQHP